MYVCVLAGHETPVMASMVDRVPQQGFTPFSFYSRGSLGGTDISRSVPVPDQNGTGTFVPVL